MGAAANALALMLADPEATERFGAALAGLMRPGLLVTLEGGLGAGKSSLCRAMIRALCNDPHMDVPSPSFALVQPYQGRDFPILHADLYRLGAEEEVEELGLYDDDQTLVLVEWPERAPSLSARADISIDLAIDPAGGRRVRLTISDDALRQAVAAKTKAFV